MVHNSVVQLNAISDKMEISNMENKDSEPLKAKKFPKSVLFILGNILLERYSFAGTMCKYFCNFW